MAGHIHVYPYVNNIIARTNALLTIRFKSSEDSPIASLETATSREHQDHVVIH
jgi:hypothetical protein